MLMDTEVAILRGDMAVFVDVKVLYHILRLWLRNVRLI